MKKISHNIRKVSKLEDNNLKFHSECNSKTKTKKKPPKQLKYHIRDMKTRLKFSIFSKRNNRRLEIKEMTEAIF